MNECFSKELTVDLELMMCMILLFVYEIYFNVLVNEYNQWLFIFCHSSDHSDETSPFT